MIEYIHYGSNKFYPSLFISPSNTTGLRNKPIGGLWASRTDAKSGWKDWCIQENFVDCDEENSFRFFISENAKVFHIYCKEDVEKLPMQPQSCDLHLLPDFEKLIDLGYDAVEYHLSEEKPVEKYTDSIYYLLYGWDCDSILILNKDIIISNNQ